MKKILTKKFVIYCLLVPFAGGFIFSSYLLIQVQLRSTNSFELPYSFLTDVLLPIVGSPFLGLVYIIPAFLTYIFSEVISLLKLKATMISFLLIMFFGGIVSFIYTINILPYSQNELRILTFLIGLIGAGLAEFISIKISF